MGWLSRLRLAILIKLNDRLILNAFFSNICFSSVHASL